MTVAREGGRGHLGMGRVTVQGDLVPKDLFTDPVARRILRKLFALGGLFAHEATALIRCSLVHGAGHVAQQANAGRRLQDHGVLAGFHFPGVFRTKTLLDGDVRGLDRIEPAGVIEVSRDPA